jgi:predicted Zn-dependent protease
MRLNPIFAGLAGLLLLSACASTDYGARQAGERPVDLATTEASLWYQMDQAEQDIIASGRLNTDPVLNDYLAGTLCQVSSTFCDDLRLYVLESSVFNAGMAPNGMTLINTGLLLRVEDEAQLAFILGHEFVHFEENHALEQHAAARNATVAAAVIGSMVSVAIAGVPTTTQTGSSGYVAIGSALSYNSAFAFSRDREREADLNGLNHSIAAGYDPAAAAAIWSNVLAELLSSENPDTVRRATRNGAYASHPLMQERIDTLRAAAEQDPARPTDPRAYRAIIRPHLQSWLDAQIARRDHDATLHLIDRLSGLGEDLGVLNYARGRTLAMRNTENDRALALDAYIEATTYADAPAGTYRGLGDLFRARGDNLDSADAFEIYLERAPDARDYAFIEQLILDLRETNP